MVWVLSYTDCRNVSAIKKSTHAGTYRAAEPESTSAAFVRSSALRARILGLRRIQSGLWFERTARGEIVLLPCRGAERSLRQGHVLAQLAKWTERDGRGLAFGCSAHYLLPDGSALSASARKGIEQLSGEGPVAGFILKLERIWKGSVSSFEKNIRI